MFTATREYVFEFTPAPNVLNDIVHVLELLAPLVLPDNEYVPTLLLPLLKATTAGS